MNSLMRVRAALVMPARAQSTMNFVQMTWSGSRESSASTPADRSALRMDSARADVRPLSSPKESRGVGPTLAMTPGDWTAGGGPIGSGERVARAE